MYGGMQVKLDKNPCRITTEDWVTTNTTASQQHSQSQHEKESAHSTIPTFFLCRISINSFGVASSTTVVSGGKSPSRVPLIAIIYPEAAFTVSIPEAGQLWPAISTAVSVTWSASAESERTLVIDVSSTSTVSLSGLELKMIPAELIWVEPSWDVAKAPLGAFSPSVSESWELTARALSGRACCWQDWKLLTMARRASSERRWFEDSPCVGRELWMTGSREHHYYSSLPTHSRNLSEFISSSHKQYWMVAKTHWHIDTLYIHGSKGQHNQHVQMLI